MIQMAANAVKRFDSLTKLIDYVICNALMTGRAVWVVVTNAPDNPFIESWKVT
jgi:hypothetical protein